ncbi:PQQ-binding-like beta-propeller repeat protein [Yinghuangia seranimata]|uniref:outer membrane protein assembly factor BamB family protein n=1 Tax=Yinghuangia seranimata TaxID=408067 RepID=UPI00248C98D9|nr:PQQ-binding-like beta-propeller repeat protein [Yinghuangia seranimata]MDI2130566.1 PQQ-binding-like beta-propeller repeat protein [Yinghuangia seranimata]
MQQLHPQDPRSIGPFRIVGRLGAGGMGRVYLGRGPSGRAVAVKTIRADVLADDGDGRLRARFAREVQAAREVDPRFTAPVVDADPDAHEPWLATAYVPGLSLSEAVTAFGPLPERTLLHLAGGLAVALADIHAAGLVHRDIKPANVMLAADGPRVIDFGIAALAGATSLTGSSQTVGTVAFMAPEQFRTPDVTAAADVFSYACVLAYAATGRAPFGSGPWTVVFTNIIEGRADLTDVPDAYTDLLRDCLSQEPGDRPTPHQVLERLPDAATAVRTGLATGWLPNPVTHALLSAATTALDAEPEPAGLLESPTRPAPEPITPVGAGFSDRPKAPPPVPPVDLVSTDASGGGPRGDERAGDRAKDPDTAAGIHDAATERDRGAGPPVGRPQPPTATAPRTPPRWTADDDPWGALDDFDRPEDQPSRPTRRWVLWAGLAAAVGGGSVAAALLRDGDNTPAASSPPVGPVWRAAPGSPVEFGSPAVLNGTVYVGNLQSTLYALDAATGATKWTFTARYFIELPPAAVGDTVYVGSKDKSVYALDAATGTEKWSYAADRPINGSPAVADGAVYVNSENSTLHALDATTGRHRWSFRPAEQQADPRLGQRTWGEGANSYSPSAAAGVVYTPAFAFTDLRVGPAGDGVLLALDAATGKVKWTFNAHGTLAVRTPVVDGVVYATDREHLHALDAATGAERWTIANAAYDGGTAWVPNAVGGVVYVPGKGGVHALDAATGASRWFSEIDDLLVTAPAVVDGSVYVSARKNLYALDAATGKKKWSFATPMPQPAAAGGSVYVPSGLAVYAIDAATGQGPSTKSPKPTAAT